MPTLSKHAVREEREDGGAGGAGLGSARSPPRAIVGSAGGGRGEHGHSHPLGLLDTGPSNAPGFEESPSSMGRPVAATTNAKTSDKKSVAERFIIPSPLNPVVTTSSSSSALIPPPRPQFTPLPTPLPLPLPFPSFGGATSSPSSGASGLALHRMRRESSNSPSSATPPPGAVPIRSNTTTSGISINPFKGNTLSSTASASVSGSGSSPSLSIRQGLSLAGSSTRAGFPLPTPSPYGPSTPSSLGDRGDWEREERDRRASNDGSSRERDRFRRMSMGGQEDGIGGGGGVTRIPSTTRKRYSSSFGNRYVGSVGSAGGGVGSGDSGRSTPASVSASTGAAGGVGALEDGKGKEQAAAGVSCLIPFFMYFFTSAFATLTFISILFLYTLFLY